MVWPFMMNFVEKDLGFEDLLLVRPCDLRIDALIWSGPFVDKEAFCEVDMNLDVFVDEDRFDELICVCFKV